MRPSLFQRVDQSRVLQELRVRDADVRRVEVARAVRPEDVATEAGEERVHVVRVAGRALLDGETDLRLRLLLRRERLPLEVGERRRDLRELRVREERDVLERHGRAVELLDRRAVRERVQRVRRELLPRRRGRREGRTEPFADSSPVQSCAPTMTSGAVSTATVVIWERIWPKSFWTTCTVTPLQCRPRVRDLCDRRRRGRRRPRSRILALCSVADVPAETATTATNAAMSKPGYDPQPSSTQHRNALLGE